MIRVLGDQCLFRRERSSLFPPKPVFMFALVVSGFTRASTIANSRGQQSGYQRDHRAVIPVVLRLGRGAAASLVPITP